MKVLRSVIGSILLFLDRTFKSKSEVSRTPERQAQVDRECASLKIYQFEACPFCIKVRRAAGRLGLNIELRDVLNNKTYEQELMSGGGEYQVPCLRIDDAGGTKWMYESGDIIAYLESRFGESKAD